MTEHLCISIRFLGGEFHGRGDSGEPEWPPSPFRLFQAIVAAAAARWRQEDSQEYGHAIKHAVPMLRWLEKLSAPDVISSEATLSSGYRLYVPDNVGDLVAASWSRGNANDIANYRTEKTVRPLLLPDGDAAVHYLWPLGSEFTEHRETLFAAVRAVSHLGWGVDLVVADATVLDGTAAAALDGDRWIPAEDGLGGNQLRVPLPGSLDDLTERYKAFLDRVDIHQNLFSPVPPLSVFGRVTYRREDDPAVPPRAVFALRRLDDSGFCAFDALRGGLRLTGMLRHLVSRDETTRALGWDETRVAAFVLGHGEKRGEKHTPVEGPRLRFIPLPSIEWRGEGYHVGDIRRVLVTVSGTFDRTEFARLARTIDGGEIIDDRTKQPVAFLSRCSEHDNAITGYVGKSATWVSVAPVILPGYDDPHKLRRRLAPEAASRLTVDEKGDILRRLDMRIEHLLRKALRQAGLPDSIAEKAGIEWRSVGFIPGADLASRYSVPDQHRRYRRLHVRLTFPTPIPGPLCIGGGKHSGLGACVGVTQGLQCPLDGVQEP